MSDIKLFSLSADAAIELPGTAAALERDLQNQIEAHMLGFLGVHLLASEYGTGKTHKGRIDSLGLDENGCPVIIEYKRSKNENVINQGLFYLDWLLDHQAEFKWLVMEKLGKDQAESIEWSGTRLICIASDFNRFDEHAVQQINRNIELMRYRYFGKDLLLLELVNAHSATQSVSTNPPVQAELPPKTRSNDKSQADRLAEAPQSLKNLYDEICQFTEQLGDEVQRKELKLYTAFKRIKNFASILIVHGNNDPRLVIYLKLPGVEAENYPNARNVTEIGHWGTGDFELVIRDPSDLDVAQELITKSYERS